MSHFTVLVIGPDVEKQLAPYHEFECTGIDDEYVVDVDITAEAREAFDRDTETRLKDPSGNLHDPFDKSGSFKPEFCKTEEGFFGSFGSNRKLAIPEGWERTEIPTKETGKTFKEFVRDYYGINDGEYGRIEYDEHGEVAKVIDRTNPNKKWDWWVIGGRWPGFLRNKDGKDCDQLTKGELDIASIRAEAHAKALETYDKAAELMGGKMDWKPWEMVREELFKGNIDEARKFYSEQLKPLEKVDEFGFFFDYDDLLVGREQYAKNEADRAFTTYAVVRDSQWYAKGEMGWWGMSNDNKEQREWNIEFGKMIDELPDDTLLTVVDCHI